VTAVVEEASLKTGPILSPKRSVLTMGEGEGREKAQKIIEFEYHTSSSEPSRIETFGAGLD